MFIADLFWSAVKLIAGSAKFPLPNWGDELNKVSPEVYEKYMEAIGVDHLEVKPGDWGTLMTLLAMQMDIEQGLEPLGRGFSEEEVDVFLQGGDLAVLKGVHKEPLKERWAPAQHRHQIDAALFAEILKFPHLAGDPFPKALSIDVYERGVYIVQEDLTLPPELEDLQKEEGFLGAYPYYVSLKLRTGEEPKSSKNWRELSKGAKVKELFTLLNKCKDICHK